MGQPPPPHRHPRRAGELLRSSLPPRLRGAVAAALLPPLLAAVGCGSGDSTTTVRIGEPAESGGFAYTVTDLGSGVRTEDPDGNVHETDGHFVAVSMTVENTSGEARSFVPELISLYDRDGNSYSPHPELTEAFGEDAERLEAGQRTDLTILFELPESALASQLGVDHDPDEESGILVSLN